MNARRDSVTVRVPGSTSNCGAGFDSLGLALEIYNRITLTRRGGAVADGTETALARPERLADARAKELADGAARAFFGAADVGPDFFLFASMARFRRRAGWDRARR